MIRKSKIVTNCSALQRQLRPGPVPDDLPAGEVAALIRQGKIRVDDGATEATKKPKA